MPRPLLPEKELTVSMRQEAGWEQGPVCIFEGKKSFLPLLNPLATSWTLWYSQQLDGPVLENTKVTGNSSFSADF